MRQDASGRQVEEAQRLLVARAEYNTEVVRFLLAAWEDSRGSRPKSE